MVEAIDPLDFSFTQPFCVRKHSSLLIVPFGGLTLLSPLKFACLAGCMVIAPRASCTHVDYIVTSKTFERRPVIRPLLAKERKGVET